MNLARVVATLLSYKISPESYGIIHPSLYVVYFIAAILFLYYLIKQQKVNFPDSFTFFFVPPVDISHPEISLRSTRTIAKRIILAYLITSASGVGIFLLFPAPIPPPPCTDPFIESAPLNIDGNSALDAFCAGNGTDGLSWETAHVIENITIHRSEMCINFQNLSNFLIIRNCTLRSYYNSCISVTRTSYIGIMLRNCTRIKIVDCQLIGFYTGIYLINVSNVIISRNHIFNSSSLCDFGTEFARGYGITCENSQLNNISNNNITLIVPGDYGLYYCGYPARTRSSISLYNANSNNVTSNLLNSITIDISVNNVIDNNTAYVIYVEAGVQNILCNNTGILELDGGGNNTLVSNNGTFMELMETNNNTLENNSIETIFLFQTWNNTLINNTANELNFAWAYNNSLYNNDMSISIKGNSIGNHIDTTNSVGGKPIHYYENQIGLELAGQSSVGQIFFINCNDSRIENNTISNNAAGIVLVRCNNNSLVNNSACNNPSNGLSFFESCNNTLLNQTSCNNSGFGIYLDSSHNNTLSNSITSNNGVGGTSDDGFVTPFNGLDGVCLEYSNDNLLANITSVNNTGCGITLFNSLDIMLINNSIDSNAVGVYIGESNNITLTENIMWGDGLETWDSHNLSIDTTNRVNGKSLLYLEGQAFREVSDSTPVGQVILINCQNFKVSNINITLVSRAIALESCRNVTLINVTASFNSEGILFQDSQDITLLKCIVSSNRRDGISLQLSSDVNLSSNVVLNNGGAGINLVGSDDNWIFGNNASFNSQSGIYVDYSDHNLIIYNTLLGNLQQGLLLEGSHNCTILSNLISQNGESGIDLRGSTYNQIMDNTLTMHDDEGVLPTASNFNPPHTGTMEILLEPYPLPEFAHCGIFSFFSDFNIFTGNLVSSNVEGFHLSVSDSNLIEGNTVMYNTNSGICLEFSRNNQILRNILRQNGGACILLLGGSEDNDIRENECDEDSMLLIYVVVAIMGVGICVTVIIFRQRHRRYRVAGASLELTRKQNQSKASKKE